MTTRIKYTNIQPTGDLAAYLEKRTGHLEKFLPTDTQKYLLEIEVGKTTKHHQQGDICRAEMNLEVNGEYFRAESERGDLLTAIDDAKRELEQALASRKGKKLSLLRRGGLRIKNLLRGLYSPRDRR